MNELPLPQSKPSPTSASLWRNQPKTVAADHLKTAEVILREFQNEQGKSKRWVCYLPGSGGACRGPQGKLNQALWSQDVLHLEDLHLFETWGDRCSRSNWPGDGPCQQKPCAWCKTDWILVGGINVRPYLTLLGSPSVRYSSASVIISSGSQMELSPKSLRHARLNGRSICAPSTSSSA